MITATKDDLLALLFVSVAALVIILLQPKDVVNAILAVGTIAYTVITWRILHHTKHQNSYTTLITLFAQIKSDYDNIGLQRYEGVYGQKNNTYNRYAALKKTLPDNISLSTLQKELSEDVIKDFSFVCFELIHLLDRIDKDKLEISDYNSIIAMTCNFYSQRVERFITNILKHEDALKNDPRINVFIALHGRMALYGTKNTINEYLSNIGPAIIHWFIKPTQTKQPK